MSDVARLEAEHVLGVQNELGEGPLWDARVGGLYWLDIKQKGLFCLYLDRDEYLAWELGEPVTALGLRGAGDLVAATARGFAFWGPDSQRLDCIATLEEFGPGVRFNDGGVDGQGRFWAGTMNEADPQAADGCLYCLNPDLTVHRPATGFTICNGLGWSPDEGTLYFTDTLRRVIWAFDYDPASGAIARRRPFVRVPETAGVPDGLAVDGQGGVWSAHWGGGRVTRYDPDGQVERVVDVPAQHVTSCAFGGRGLDELYITTAWHGLSPAQRRGQPLAGDLFRARVEVSGKAEPCFTG
jgi:sugar lactone lactonase YvrE